LKTTEELHASIVSEDGDYPPARQAWATVAILMAITITALLDRFLPAVLMEPIKHDLHLTDTSVSLIQGYAFAIFYCVAGLPLARLVDCGNRRNLIIAAVIVWSAMTFGCALAQSYVELFVARAGVGISEAVLAPCAYSIIADCFPRRLRGRANGCYYAALSIGSSASFMLGGLVFDRISHAGGLTFPVLGLLAPWRATFALAAIPGLVVALLTFFFREPARRERSLAADGGKIMPFLRANGRTLVPLYAGFGIMSFVTLIPPSWATTFYHRIHDVSLLNSGFAVGMIVLISGTVGPVLGGIIGDYWAKDDPSARFKLPLIGLIIGIPLLAVWPLLPMVELSYFVLGCGVTIMSMGLSSAPAIIQEISPNGLRARAIAINQIVQFITTGFSPTAVALITDLVFGDPLHLNWSLTLTILIGGVIALLVCLAALRPYRNLVTAVLAKGAVTHP
jgi:MFS family permease